MYSVYIKTDADSRITSVESGVVINNVAGWIKIDEGDTDRYYYARQMYFDQAIINTDGTHRYLLENGQVREATDAEIAAEQAKLQAAELVTVKAAKIAASKMQLADYLESHPLTYTDGKQYSVTAEKQSLLTSALARYQIATAAGVQTTLKWNATGEECTVWEYADLAALALAIASYVEPLVGQQQAAEVAINACSTVAEVEAIVIVYGS